MNKKTIVLLLALSLVLNIMLGVYLFLITPDLSDSEIKEKFACDRITQEARQTDIFCQNPDLYREAVR